MNAVIASAIAMIVVAPVASAEDRAPVAGAPCGASNKAQTFANPEYGPPYEVLQCMGFGEDSSWQKVDGIQRPAQAWYTYGPTQTLHGGDLTGEWWVGLPLTLNDICVVEQHTATGQPESSSNNTGQYFGFRLLPDLEVLYLKGRCSWQPGQSRLPG